ncbi:hybrid sensor histidine kinase/response regulator [Aquabacterium soli]|uniref:Chemotaxis protein CheA n=1 Tax=Aquabacterium soli TaxID=2493092 RepID=A0A3R8S3K3_9BURK|nr:Hpt domain-containing protein [Aquabacterium soli]RRS05250.1 hybrid sensor histidine kinase/response regulator [Aquabacterium soli]
MDSPQATPMSDDLSALAWVHEEVRKSLEAAHKALHRCLKEAEATGFSDVDALDPAILRSARQQIHQGVGALELAGLPAGALLLRASEALVQRFVARPQSLNEEAIKAIEAASFALLDLMRRRLAGKPVSALALFPQYEALMEQSGSELARPSDLWVQEWPPVSLDVPLAAPADAVPRRVDDQAVAEFETTLLQLLKGAPVAQAQRLVDLCGQLAADAQARQAHREAATWVLACGFLEALAGARLPLSLHVKRVLSALLSQLRNLVRQPGMPSDRLAHELLFFCAQAEPEPGADAGASSGTGVLDRLREAFRLRSHQQVDLVQSALGRFDPAWVGQAAKRVVSAKDAWSSVAGGELLRLNGLREPFALVADSIRRLYPDGDALGQALLEAVDATVASGAAPGAALAMEVATSLLYLEASLDEAEFEHPAERERVQRLAQRLQAVSAGQPPEPLEPWMEGLYRQVSDRQTIGSVVQELRSSLGECEKRIDQFFRDHEHVTPLVEVPSQLQSMKGVLAVLGLDAAAHAVSRMRADVEALLAPGADLLQAANSGVHDRLASNLGAVGFLVDMLAVQPGLAKHLFVFNADTGLLSPIMGRAPQPQPDIDPIEVMARPAEQVERVHSQEVAETLAESVVRADVPLADLSDELQHLADTPLVQDQPSLAASLANAQAALDRAAATDDQVEQQQARDEAVAALNDFVQSVTEPVGVDTPIDVLPEPLPQAPLVPERPAAPEATGLEEDDEMRDIFIEEAREVIGDARTAVAGLSRTPDDVGLLTTVRRAFHTLKGSSRMVGLGDFGEAAWAYEQLYNTWLASQVPASDELMGLSIEALTHLERWVDAITARQDRGWSPAGLVRAAEALRQDGRRETIVAPDVPSVAEAALPADAPADLPAELPEPVELVLPEHAEPLVELPELPPEIELIEVSLVDDDAVAREAEAQALAATAAANDTPPLTDTVADVFSPPEVEPPAHAGDPVEAPPLLEEAVDRLVLNLREDEASRDAVSETTPAEQTPAFEDTAPPVFSDTLTYEEGPPLDVALPEALSDEPLPTDQIEMIDIGEAIEMPADPADTADVTGGLDLAEPDFALDLPDEPAAETISLDLSEPEPALDTAPEPLVEGGLSDDEQVKVIGPLRISIPLFNIYLNEADEQSRRLSMQLGEWALEWHHRSIGDETIALAHSLAGNSGTVGYTELSRLARALEHALARSQSSGRGDEASATLFSDAAEEIRRLLHQFAAGFLKSPPEDLLQRLEHYEPSEALRADVANRQHLRLVRTDGDEALDVDAADAGEPALSDDPAEPPFEQAPEVQAPDEPVPQASVPPDDAQSEVVDVPLDSLPQQTVSLGLPEIKPFEPLPEEPASEHLVRAVGTDVDLGPDADIESVDAIDADLFPIFEEEALELLPQLAGDMRQWVQHPERQDLATACMRTLHTFKGGARLAGAMRLGELAHRMESAIERLIAGDQADPADLEALQARSDVLAEVFESLQRRDLSVQQDLAQLPASLVAPGTGDMAPAYDGLVRDAGDSALADLPSAQVGPASTQAQDGQALSAVPIDWSSVRTDFQPGAQAGADAVAASSIAAVRVRPRLLDRLVNHAGEVSIARTRLSAQMQQMRGSVGDLTENLDRLRQQLRDIELQAETQLSTRMEAARASQQNFDPLEFDRYTRFQELTRMMAESVNDVATVQRGLVRNLESAEDQLAAQSRLTRDLQDDLLRTRMVEFEGLSDRLYRVVRQAAKETGKQVRLDLVGGHTEVDRGVLDRMAGAFEHLLRNSVTHGIEAPASRQAQGKEPMGTIIVAVHQEGNEVAIEFRDDGAGLDLERIRRKAEAQQLLVPGAEASEADLAQLIFTPGFSTAESVTELAGRGIGMDVVRAEVNAMGGRIETATAAGQGTSFKLILPLTTAVTKVVMVRCGDLVVSIPTNLVELVRRARAEEIEHAYASGTLPYADLTLPFFWFGALLQHSPRGLAEGRSLPVVVVRSAQQRVALHVDEVLGNQDVVVKNLGPQLSRVPGLAGMTLLASGAVALIYNPVALATVYGAQAQTWSRQARVAEAGAPADQVDAARSPAALEAPAAPLVLVVDDSLTVRRVTQRLLTREGYRVTLAKDGLEALEKMAEEIPLVVLSDIEMPRMDGFDLARNLRGDERWKNVPIVMITSRIAQKHRDYAAELGVNHYLGKPYSEEELVSLVARYTHAALSQQDAEG